MVLCSAPASEMGALSGDVVRPAPRLGPRLVHACSSCGADGRFAVGAAGALKDFPVCQRATQAMSVVTLIRGWVLARHRFRMPRTGVCFSQTREGGYTKMTELRLYVLRPQNDGFAPPPRRRRLHEQDGMADGRSKRKFALSRLISCRAATNAESARSRT